MERGAGSISRRHTGVEEAMINLPCGFEAHRHFQRHGSCGTWVGYMVRTSGYPPRRPYFHNDIAWCGTCIKGFAVRHLGQGLFVRPREESDVPVGGPSLEALYKDDPMPYKNKKQPTWPGLHVNRPSRGASDD